ncbi:bifunctional adenosylcobinamide kinase/adenosylcobinamide-phosphate guanylyltransferase [Roseibium sp.]|uniref:bifunctional adenosylcobinamide kinase/adenosylcobinamide-phosphate guanylyltransferase n=1 Tax=Roseibium sp. TaxID=1936156 RepID=UPI003A9751E6
MSGASLVLGGARSGKSAFAEKLARDSGLRKIYLATSPRIDTETEERIALHRQARGRDWQTVEEQLDLSSALEDMAAADSIILVDCLTLWLNNLVFHERDLPAEIDCLYATAGALQGRVIFVSNEIGMGLVPADALSRSFRDAQGRLNQRMAEVCDKVIFVAAGLPLQLKPSSYMDQLS